MSEIIFTLILMFITIMAFITVVLGQRFQAMADELSFIPSLAPQSDT